MINAVDTKSQVGVKDTQLTRGTHEGAHLHTNTQKHTHPLIPPPHPGLFAAVEQDGEGASIGSRLLAEPALRVEVPDHDPRHDPDRTHFTSATHRDVTGRQHRVLRRGG